MIPETAKSENKGAYIYIDINQETQRPYLLPAVASGRPSVSVSSNKSHSLLFRMLLCSPQTVPLSEMCSGDSIKMLKKPQRNLGFVCPTCIRSSKHYLAFSYSIMKNTPSIFYQQISSSLPARGDCQSLAADSSCQDSL